jgi:hypothetical protein
MIECPQGHRHWWPATCRRGLSFSSVSSRFWVKPRHDLNARLRDECRGVRKCHLFSQLLDLCSVSTEGERNEARQILRLPKASAKGKFLCYHALLINEGVGMRLADHSCLQDIVLNDIVHGNDGQEDQRPDKNRIKMQTHQFHKTAQLRLLEIVEFPIETK